MNSVLFGDCRDTLPELAAQGVRVQCVVTSPPYWGLRSYLPKDHPLKPLEIGSEPRLDCLGWATGSPCGECFICHLVAVFRAVRGVLADDGVCWINMGDSYHTAAGAVGNSPGGGDQGERFKSFGQGTPANRIAQPGLKAKDMCAQPWRLGLALQADGWYLRQDIIWHKPNTMPESVTDRCTKAHEYLFLLSKSERYYWDAEAMKEQATGALPGNQTHKHPAEYEASGDEKFRTKAGLVDYTKRQRSKRDSFKREDSKRAEVIPGQTVGTHRPDRDESEWDTATRNRRSVWTVPTVPYSGAHFATFPPALIEPCILAGSRVGDVVLDPFIGSGTVAQVAQRLGRSWIGCEINEINDALQRERTVQIGLALIGR